MDEKKIEQIKASDPYFEEIRNKSTFSFDIVLWLYRFLKYWYLFVLSIPFFLSIAYLENKSWVPIYAVRGIIMLEAKGNSAITNAVALGNILRNAKNQSIVLESYEMTQRTVDELPHKMYFDYFRVDKFKTINLYETKPIQVDTLIYIKDEAYKYAFNLAPISDEECLIYIPSNEKNGFEGYEAVIPFDKIVEDPNLFRLKISKTKYYTDDFEPYSLRFLTRDDLMGMFLNRVSSSPDKDTDAMSVSMMGQVPARDVDYLTVMFDVFQDYNLSLKNEQADKTISFIDIQLKIIQDSLLLSRASLDWFQETTGVFQVSSERLRNDLEMVNSERDEYSIFEKTLLLITESITKDILSDNEIIIPLSTSSFKNPKLGQIMASLQPLVKDYNELLKKSKNLGYKNPLYEVRVKEINDSRAAIINYLKIEQLNFQRDKDDFVKKYEDINLKIANLPPQERDFLTYQREYKTYEMYDQFLKQKKQEAQLQKASNIADNNIWEMPRQIGGAMNGGEKNKRYMFHLMIALLLPSIFIILKEEILNFTISSKEECEKLSGYTVIGTIENTQSKRSRSSSGLVIVKNFPKSSFAESFRNIRVRIEYLAQRENKITTLVTSTEPADGKTYVAVNLASVYQLMGKKVVVIDLDLRRPSVAKTLNVNHARGVSNYLIGQVTLDEIIMQHPDYGFDVITAGTLPPNPSELIKTEKTKELLRLLKDNYDYVIVDCSPVGLVSDAYILGKLVDTTLFVVRRGKTNKSFFKSVIKQVRYDGIENVALIFNDVKGREGYYGTSRYYGNNSYYLKKNSYYHDDFYDE